MEKKRKASGRSDSPKQRDESPSTVDLVPRETASCEQDFSFVRSNGNASQVSLDESHRYEDHVALSSLPEEGSCSPVITPFRATTKFPTPFRATTKFPPPLRGMSVPRQVSLSPTHARKIQALPEFCKSLPPMQPRAVKADFSFEQPELPVDMMFELDALNNFLEDCF
jgi:hypothetical protein